jgi:hypothetical protein
VVTVTGGNSNSDTPRWEQETLNELERNTSFEQQAQLTLVQDEMEQLQNIEIAQTIIEEEEEERE